MNKYILYIMDLFKNVFIVCIIFLHIIDPFIVFFIPFFEVIEVPEVIEVYEVNEDTEEDTDETFLDYVDGDLHHLDGYLYTKRFEDLIWNRIVGQKFITNCSYCDKITTYFDKMICINNRGGPMIVCEDCHCVKNKNKRKDFRKTIWTHHCGQNYTSKCFLCEESITVINFVQGHDKSRSKGGSSDVKNVRPICAPCNYAQGTDTFKMYKLRLNKLDKLLKIPTYTA